MTKPEQDPIAAVIRECRPDKVAFRELVVLCLIDRYVSNTVASLARHVGDLLMDRVALELSAHGLDTGLARSVAHGLAKKQRVHFVVRALVARGDVELVEVSAGSRPARYAWITPEERTRRAAAAEHDTVTDRLLRGAFTSLQDVLLERIGYRMEPVRMVCHDGSAVITLSAADLAQLTAAIEDATERHA